MGQANERETESRIVEILSRTFHVEKRSLSSMSEMPDVPGWDSLGHMSLLANLETEFGVRFPVYAISELTSVEAIARAIKGLLL